MARLAEAHLVLGDIDKAVEWAIKGHQFYESGLINHCTLITALAHAGRLEEAKAECAELLTRRPDASIELLRNTLPFTHHEYLKIYVEGLLWAGLPE